MNRIRTTNCSNQVLEGPAARGCGMIGPASSTCCTRAKRSSRSSFHEEGTTHGPTAPLHDRETEQVGHVLQRRSHLSARKVERVCLRPPSVDERRQEGSVELKKPTLHKTAQSQ